MAKEEEVKVTKTYTEDEVEKLFVRKDEYDRLSIDYNKLAQAFNTLIKEYNDLHLKYLVK